MQLLPQRVSAPTLLPNYLHTHIFIYIFFFRLILWRFCHCLFSLRNKPLTVFRVHMPSGVHKVRHFYSNHSKHTVALHLSDHRASVSGSTLGHVLSPLVRSYEPAIILQDVSFILRSLDHSKLVTWADRSTVPHTDRKSSVLCVCQLCAR